MGLDKQRRASPITASSPIIQLPAANSPQQQAPTLSVRLSVFKFESIALHGF